jgi:hypothetical protein
VSYACSAVKKVSVKNERQRYVGILTTANTCKYISVYASPRWRSCITVTSSRLFSTNRTGSTDGPGDDEGKHHRQAAGRENSDNEYPTHSLPATVVIPEEWPHVPLIAINRNPVFPRFIKLIEVGETLRNDFVDF